VKETWHAVGIYLNECNSSTVSGNTLTNNQEGVALDYYTDGSGSSVTIDVNGGSITGGTYGIKIGGDSTLGSDLTCNVGNTAAVTIDGTSGIGIYATRNVNLTISNSTIKNTASGGYGGVYIYLGECPVTIDNNTIQSNGGSGIYVSYVQGLVTIDRNTIQSNEDYGIYSYGLGAATPNTLTVTHNTITGSPTGIGSYLSTTTAYCNSIHGNTNYGVENWDATVLDAEYNWWGNASGPGDNGPGTGDNVSANVDYDPWLTAVLPCEVESSNATGATWNTFQAGDSVYVYGSGYSASTSYNISVVADTTWTDGMPIPAGEAGTATTVYTDGTGAIAYSNMEGFGTSPALIWTSATVGDYDIVVDVNGNGYYDSCMDALDDKDVGDAGFNTSPKDCTPEIEVNKTVWDPVTGTWVEEITSQANISGCVRYRIQIQNNGTCCDLTNLAVNDTLPGFLIYNNSAIPFEPTDLGGNKYQWTFPTLNKSETKTIEFNATVCNTGNGTNEASATAWCAEFGVECSDGDGAYITAVGCGDVNGDGVVNWADYLTLRYTVVGATGWTIKTSEWASDVNNCDGTVNWADYLTLRYTVVGVPGWTVECCGCN
jgi:parallel beta-helix repeat protein